MRPRANKNLSSGLDRTSTPFRKMDRRSATNVASSFSMGSAFSPHKTNSEESRSKTHTSLCVTKLPLEACRQQRCATRRASHRATSGLRQSANLESTMLTASVESPGLWCPRCPLCGDILCRRHAHKNGLAEAGRYVLNREEILTSN